MKQEVSLSMFREAFNRMDRGEQFSYEGLGELYEYLDENCPDMELDVVAICCDFTEYGDFEEVAENYTDMPSGEDYEDEEELEEARREWLMGRTLLLEYPGGMIIQDF